VLICSRVQNDNEAGRPDSFQFHEQATVRASPLPLSVRVTAAPAPIPRPSPVDAAALLNPAAAPRLSHSLSPSLSAKQAMLRSAEAVMATEVEMQSVFGSSAGELIAISPAASVAAPGPANSGAAAAPTPRPSQKQKQKKKKKRPAAVRSKAPPKAVKAIAKQPSFAKQVSTSASTCACATATAAAPLPTEAGRLTAAACRTQVKSRSSPMKSRPPRSFRPGSPTVTARLWVESEPERYAGAGYRSWC